MSHPSATEALTSDPFEGSSYCALRRIAVGGSGEVYEAEHIALGKHVAVKLLRKGGEDAEEGEMSMERMRVEAQALARLRSPHLVNVCDWGHTADGRPFYVMDLLTGATLLREVGKRGCLPAPEAVGYVRQLLEGLAVAHRAGIVHRDVKLENLFLEDAAEGARVLKILDFGIAKVLPHATGVEPPSMRTGDGTILGTPRYMAPEQALGHPVDARADLYAAGVVLYELLTGRDPFYNVLGTARLLHAAVSREPPRPSQVAEQLIDPALEDVVMRALAKRPEDRYGSAAELSAALAHAMDLAAAMERVPAGVPRPGASLGLALVVVVGSAVLSALAGLWLTRMH
jgi:eukaryotic-like serine/threonine-protein kinase